MTPFRSAILFACLLVVAVTQTAAQTGFANKAELEKAANDLFAKAEYSKAKPLFSQLLSQDAMNPDYNYRFGACIMYTEADPAKPLPYIEGGANSPGVNPEAYYFLGIVSRFNYRFDQSTEAFQKAKSKGFSAPNIDLDREIQISRNGRVLFNDAIRFKPGMDKEVIASEFYRPYDFRKLKGKVIPTPPNFKTKFDEKQLTEAYIYAPAEAQSLVYASYGDDGSNGRDLYRVNKLPNGEFGLPLRLPDVINTKFDEDFAFLDEVSNTLYFSSKGHNTMGGYDVFSSRYNEQTESWSVPVNLQFPVNSPFDDFLYLTDPKSELAFFTSTRNTPEGMVRVFRTDFQNPGDVEMTVISGRFDDRTDSVANFMEAQVIDPESKEVIGTYRSHMLTGKYVFLLPPRVGYNLNVSPRGASGFNFLLDVPKKEAYQTLRQGMVYTSTQSDATLQLTNYFNKIGDTDSLTEVRVKLRGQLVEKMPEISAELLAQAKAQRNAATGLDELAANKAKEEAKQLEEQKRAAEQQALAAAKARQDSIAQAQSLAAKQLEDQKRAAEQQSIAAAKARQDSIAQAQSVAAKQLEEQKRAAEQQSIAAAKAREDSIAQAQSLAGKQLEEQKRAAEQQSIAVAKARQDSIAQAQSVAAKQLEEQKRAAEQQSLAAAKARQDSIAQAQILAAKQLEEQKIEAEKQKAATVSKEDAQKLLDEELAAKARATEELAAAQRDSIARSENEKTRLAELQAMGAVKARMDSIRLVKEVAERKVKEQEEEELRIAKEQARIEELELRRLELAARLEAEKERQRMDSLVEAQTARVELDRVASTEIKRKQAAEDERLREEQRLAMLAMKEEQEKRRLEVEEQQKRELAEAKRLAEAEKKIKDANVAVQQPKAASPDQQAAPVAESTKPNVPASETVKGPKVNEKPESVAVKTVETPKVTEVEVAKTADPEPKVEAKRDTTSVLAGTEPAKTDTSAAELSESEIFRQTLERIEAQRKLKEEQVRLKAEREELARAEVLKKREAAAAEAREKALEEARSSGDTVKLRAIEQEIETAQKAAAADTSSLVAELKSDADPALYLAEMNAVEKRIADDAKKQGKKDYTLRPMPEIYVPDRKAQDPAILASIERDRKVVEEHRAIAAEQELLLNERLRKDRETIGIADPALDEELRQAEDAALAGTSPKPEGGKSKSLQDILAKAEEVKKADEVRETAPVEKPGSETKSEIADVAAPAVAKQAERPAETVVPAPKTSTPVVAEKKVETEVVRQPAPKEETKVAAEPVKTEVPSETVTPKAETISPVVVEQPRAVRVQPDMTGRDAALRDYGRRSVDFSSIADAGQRSLIQRMAAEDRGRMAVLKRLENARAKNANEAKSVETKQRTMDVLANAPVALAREEQMPSAFDRNDLRRRKNVDFRIIVALGEFEVSEKVRESLDPLYLSQLQLPEFELLTDYQTTPVDARRTRNHLRDLGFTNSAIAPFLSGAQVSMSEALNAPLVE